MAGKMNLMPSSANATAGDTINAMKTMLGQFVPTGIPDGKQIVTLRIDLLDAYPKQHIFGMRELEELAENIQAVGITDPIHVRPKGMRYEILSGHRRSEAAKLAGLEEVPAIVENVDDNEADLIFCDNLYHRKTLLPSERGAAYKVQVEALQRKAGTNCPSVSAVAAQMGTNRKEVYRYIKLMDLVPEFLDSDYLEAGEKAPAGRKFHIYQLKSGEENHLLRFCGLDVLQRERGMGFAPELKNYELVYSGVMKENETLEDIYSRFNVDLPKDFFGHSLSVSDVVAVEWNGHLTANYVDSIGFQNFPQMAQEITQQQNELLSLCQAIADYDAAHGTESAFIEYDYDKDGWQPCDGTTLEQLKASYPQCVKPSFEVLQFRCKDEVYQAQIKFEGKTSWAGMRRQSGQLYVVTGSRVVGDWQRLNFNAQQVAQYEAFLNRHLEQEACISR